jgi:ligand-binding sensor domain-containing protein
VSDYSIDVWQTEQGLPQDSVTAIVQTRDGYLWLGTYNGLVRFDGVRFKIFDTSNTPEFGDNRITSLFEDADGTLWIGHETGGLTQLRAGKFSAVNPGNDWPGGAIFAMGTDADGVLWLLNREGTLLSLQGAKLVAPNLGSGENVPSLAKDKNGELWVVRGRLLGSLKKGRLVPWQSGAQPDTGNVQRACGAGMEACGLRAAEGEKNNQPGNHRGLGTGSLGPGFSHRIAGNKVRRFARGNLAGGTLSAVARRNQPAFHASKWIVA